jgi:hypothetical protein
MFSTSKAVHFCVHPQSIIFSRADPQPSYSNYEPIVLGPMQEMIIFLETVSQTDPLLELDFPIDPAVGLECHLSSLGGETQMDPVEFGISDRSASIRHCPEKGVLSKEGADRTHASRHRGSTTLLLTRTDLQTSGFEGTDRSKFRVRISNGSTSRGAILKLDPLIETQSSHRSTFEFDSQINPLPEFRSLNLSSSAVAP